MKLRARKTPAAVALLVLSAILTVAPAGAAGFGIESVDTKLSDPRAGHHPDFTTTIVFPLIKTETEPRVEDIVANLPPGFYGNPNLTPRCLTGDLVRGECPVDSQVGVIRVKLFQKEKKPSDPQRESTLPVFNLAPVHPKEEVARLGLNVGLFPIFIDASIRTAGDYGITAAARSLPGVESPEFSELTVWGNPQDPSHDKLRMTIIEGVRCSSVCPESEGGPLGGERPSGLEKPIAFWTNPSACQQGTFEVFATSYQLPGQIVSASSLMEPIIECTGLPFAPTFEVIPTSHVAGAPTGLETTFHLPQQSPEAVDSPATAMTREARVSLPEGMSIAAGAADGIAACSEEQVGFHKEVDAACPDASKLGTATITSPPLPEPIEGALYQRTPRPGQQFGLWLVVDALGLHVKIPGEIEPDPTTGQLTAVFRDLPQVPTEAISIDVFGGPRAPLKNPDECGTYATSYTFSPHSDDPPVVGSSEMTIDQGCNQGFSPKLEAGVVDPKAGAFSPFVFDLIREDGEQSLRGFELTLPPGEVAKLKGVPLCPDAAAAAGSCPADSKIGHVVASSGPGPFPLWVPQPGKDEPSIHLAGPYQGAPFSIVTEVPAQAGPFDLGVVTVRSALQLDPESALVTVKADPLPQYFEGVGLTYRRIHAIVDRPEFSLSPTDCSALAVNSRITSNRGTVATPSSPFQVGGCKALQFKPKLSLRIKGDTVRNSHPALSATLKARKGDANIARTEVVLPRAFFIDQNHISNPCTRVQFNEDACPKGSILGRVKAFTPLLDKPLQGRVIFRSNGGERELPDIVLDLEGQIHIVLVGFIDSVGKKGSEVSRVRTTFANVPDAPVSKFTLNLNGGKKGLLVLSRNICKADDRVSIKMRAQNGRRLEQRPALKTDCKHGKR
jgi:hypothetical protein